jgi:hypothetical protein
MCISKQQQNSKHSFKISESKNNFVYNSLAVYRKPCIKIKMQNIFAKYLPQIIEVQYIVRPKHKIMYINIKKYSYQASFITFVCIWLYRVTLKRY